MNTRSMRNDLPAAAIALVNDPPRGEAMRARTVDEAIAVLERAFDAHVVERCADAACEICGRALDRAA